MEIKNEINMYKVISSILSLPYYDGGTMKGDGNYKPSLHWFKRDMESGNLTGLSSDEAIDLKNFLDKFCLKNFKSNKIEIVAEVNIPDDALYEYSSTDIPKFYPLEDLIKFGCVSSIPFDEGIIGYNDFFDNNEKS